MLRVKLIGCPSTQKEVESLGLTGGMDCEYLDFSYHAAPDQLQKELQKKIDNSQDYSAIVLTYGRCSKATAGLVSPKAPIVLPRVHDCFELLLGCGEKRRMLADRNPAAYYFSAGWLDYGRSPYAEYREYVERYGEEEARYLIEALYGKYCEAIFVKTCLQEDTEKYRVKLKEIAAFFCWAVGEVEGDLSLLRALVTGTRLRDDVIHIPPGKPVCWESLDERQCTGEGGGSNE
ncbi:DUF1638 domain-containing protein [Acetonema longum]|uniref:DUF1638 domain-containing protein n=1 Tax=Acetonema longum TaxID=2374 RepID=UPI0019308FF4|nr:DUF1638 domain-containing protein [Acetonema longum]